MRLLRKPIIMLFSALLALCVLPKEVNARENEPAGNYITVSLQLSEGDVSLLEGTEFEISSASDEAFKAEMKAGKDGRCYAGNKWYVDNLSPGTYVISVKNHKKMIRFKQETMEISIEDKTVLPQQIEVSFIGHVYGVDHNGEIVGNDGQASTIIWDTTFGTGQFYCGNSDAKAPAAVGGVENIGTSRNVDTAGMVLYNGSDYDWISKVLYYGWKGPKQWEGFTSGRYALPYSSFLKVDIEGPQIKELNIHEERGLGQFITHVALNHYHNEGRDWWGAVSPTAAEKQDGFSDFMAFLQTQPLPPADFKVYVWENYEGAWTEGNKRPLQDMFFTRMFASGDYDRKNVIFSAEIVPAKLCIRKNYADDPDQQIYYPLNGAVYRLYYDEKAEKPALDINGKEVVFTIREDGLSNEIELYYGETYYLKESSAPEGFVLDETVYRIIMDETDVIKDVSEQWQKVRLILQKKDSETGERKPQGYGSFKGAEYGIYKRELELRGFTLVEKVFTDESGKAISGDLPAGIYYVRELKAPEGYLLNEEQITVEAYGDNSGRAVLTYDVDLPEKPTTVTVTKVASDSSGKDIVVSGALLHIEDEQGNVIVPQWKSTDKPFVIKGLTEGKTLYVVEDSNPEGYLKLDSRQAFTVADGDVKVFNERVPAIRTKSFFSDNELNVHLKTEKLDISDEVMLSNLTIGTQYKIKASLVNMDDGSVISSEEKKLKADNTEQTLIMNFMDIRCEDRMCVNEELYRINDSGNYDLISTHKGIDDPAQQIFIPYVSTEAVDDSDEDHLLFNSGTQVIRDTIRYHNLVAGKKYDIRTELVYADTGKAVTDTNGKPLIFNNSFTADDSDGEMVVLMEIDAERFKGKSIVVYEEISLEGNVVAVHKDPKNKAQTVTIPDLLTQASFTNVEGSSVLLSDEVELIGFTKDTELEITATLMDYATGKPLINSKGEPYQQKMTVTASGEKEKVNVSVKLDGTEIDGRKLVFFEEGRDPSSGELLVVHRDWDNRKQTVEYTNPAETGDISGLMFYVGRLGLSMIAASVIMTASGFSRKRKTTR
ncbi:MAG: VaFE repeat-containing surface-anchored protein [Erysipelotrichaceae bacterium]|nr:VaFE repeat-containing surface-anchored protein [Erysipelotrichaceae bacterium]